MKLYVYNTAIRKQNANEVIVLLAFAESFSEAKVLLLDELNRLEEQISDNAFCCARRDIWDFECTIYEHFVQNQERIAIEAQL